jgi:hypothetical protein
MWRQRAPNWPRPTPGLVKRMRRICGKAIVADIRPIAIPIDGPLALMAIAAQRAQWAKTELVPIAAMSRVVIGDGGRRHAPLLLAQGAERALAQLKLGPRSPALQVVPGPPRQRLGGCEVAGGHQTNRSLCVGTVKPLTPGPALTCFPKLRRARSPVVASAGGLRKNFLHGVLSSRDGKAYAARLLPRGARLLPQNEAP